MLQNYISTALRNALSDKLYSAINILGLAVGLTAVILITLYVRYETSYDQFLPNSERIYRLETSLSPPGLEKNDFAYGTGRAKGVLEEIIPGIEGINRLVYRGTSVRKDESLFTENVMHTDGNFFEVFQLSFVEGNAALALGDASSVVISQSMARKYFGSQRALGQVLTLGGDRDFRVSGVIEDLPRNSHLIFDMAILFDEANFTPEYYDSWSNVIVYVYFLLEPGTDADAVRATFPEVTDRYVLPDIRSGGFDVEHASEIMQWHLVALEDIHLYGADSFVIKPGGSPASVMAFMLIAILVLSLASINYTNLAMARSLLRTREVSLRKVMGAKRGQIAAQFLGESMFMAVAALILAFAASELSLPFFSDFLNADFSLGVFMSPAYVAGIVAFILITGLLSGFYPSFYLASVKPSKFLSSGRSGTGSATSALRQTLVVVQFSIAIALLIGMSIIYLQTNFLRALDPGYEREGIVFLRNINNEAIYPSLETLKRRLLAHPDVTHLTMGLDLPSDQWENGTRFDVSTSSLPNGLVLQIHNVDQDFFQTFGIEPVAGRLFSEQFGQDLMRDFEDTDFTNGSVIINAEAARQLGFLAPDEAIGQTYRMVAEFITEPVWVEGTVVGVVPSFHYRSVKDAIRPQAYNVDKRTFKSAAVRFDTRDIKTTIAFIEDTWKDLYPNQPITLEFMEGNMELLYLSDVKDGQLLALFAILAFILSSLGLYGLAALAAQQRTKEIGIRKVLGASVSDIVGLMVWQFSKPVLLANVIAWPLAWYFASGWLGGFVQRISINPMIFVAAGGVALVTALVTVFVHAYRSARINPIYALRYE